MRKIVATFFISLDGVVESPQAWHFPFSSPEMRAAIEDGLAGSDTLLMGRRTYLEWLSVWPTSKGTMADLINTADRYVVSTSLEQAEWQGTHLIRGGVETDVEAAVQAVKSRTGKDIAMSGSATLVKWLARRGLVDDLRLMIHPVVVGSGQRLFDAEFPTHRSKCSTPGPCRPGSSMSPTASHSPDPDPTYERQQAVPTLNSADNTPIAYERRGTGPALIVVDGALCHRRFGPSRKIAAALAPRFTVFTYDRRGRGDSGDSEHYAREREIDDIAALIDKAGGSANVLGCSSGAVLALDAANRLPQISRLAVYEAPVVVDPTGNVLPADFTKQLQEHVRAGHRSAAVKQFMKHVGTPKAVVALMPLVLPVWSQLKAVAHTLPYDLQILEGVSDGRPLPGDRWSNIAAPTLVMHGGKSPQWMADGSRALATLLSRSEHRTLQDQTHMVKPHVLADALNNFLSSDSTLP